MGKRGGLFIVSVLLAALAVVGAGAFLGWQFVNAPSSAENRDVVYEVHPGRSFGAIARDLEGLGVVKNAQFFSLFARFTGDRQRIKAGEYLLNTSFRPKDVLSVITSGRSIARPFTVSEGLNVFEIAALYESQKLGTAADFLKLARDPALAKALTGYDVASLEGFLFPETYQVTKFTTAKELITSMVSRFNLVWKDVLAQKTAADIAKSADAVPAVASPAPLSPLQTVTLASIIEKETGAPQERPMISSVFHNRLGRGMRLQTDPTIIYGIADETGSVPTNISRADITRPTKYNTYVISGLPPGPIANPGRSALMAAMAPASSTYLFFVSRNDGTHVFTSDYKDHEKAVREFQLDPKARAGKSWRDLGPAAPPSH